MTSHVLCDVLMPHSKAKGGGSKRKQDILKGVYFLCTRTNRHVQVRVADLVPTSME